MNIVRRTLCIIISIALLASGLWLIFRPKADTTYGMKYILHAGGVTPDGRSGTNSLEAIDFSYEQGYRALELDFNWTSDNKLVCVHDWSSSYTFLSPGGAPTYDEFESARASTYGYTSLTLEHAASWLRLHSDVCFVTDIKERPLDGAKLIAETCPDILDRFIIQIYHPDEYDQVSALGFTKIILTVYQMTWSEKTDTQFLLSFMSTHQLFGFTFPVELTELAGYLDALKVSDVPLYVHTVNGEEQQSFFDMGIYGIYTDTGAVNSSSNQY